MTAIVYLIHFDEARAHARHYLGSSTRPLERLADHANGKGARLTEVLFEDQQGWTVAALFQPKNPDDLRKIESSAKRQKNACKYCPICSKNPIAPKGTLSIPFQPITAHQLRTNK